MRKVAATASILDLLTISTNCLFHLRGEVGARAAGEKTRPFKTRRYYYDTLWRYTYIEELIMATLFGWRWMRM